MTALYFVEKQIKRYPWRSAVYFLACFLLVLVLFVFGEVSLSLKTTKEVLKNSVDERDCIIVSSQADISQSNLFQEEHIRGINEEYSASHATVEFDILNNGKLYNFDFYHCASDFPEHQKEIFEKEYGRSPLTLGRVAETEHEVLIGESALQKLGIIEEEYSLILGTKVTHKVIELNTKNYIPVQEWTIVGVFSADFNKGQNAFVDDAYVFITKNRAGTTVQAYAVYPEFGWLDSVYRTLSDKYGKNCVEKHIASSDAFEKLAQHIVFFDKVFVFLLILLCLCFVAVTLFSVLFYTAKQSEFYAVTSAFGMRRRDMVLSEVLFCIVELFLSIVVATVTGFFLQKVVLDTLGGVFEIELATTSLGMAIALSGIVFGVMSICVVAGVFLGMFAVKKKNL